MASTGPAEAGHYVRHGYSFADLAVADVTVADLAVADVTVADLAAFDVRSVRL